MPSILQTHRPTTEDNSFLQEFLRGTAEPTGATKTAKAFNTKAGGQALFTGKVVALLLSVAVFYSSQ